MRRVPLAPVNTFAIISGTMSIEQFGEPIDENAPLWRYMKASTFFAILDGWAFFPSVATLRNDDKLEGSRVCHETELCESLDFEGNPALFSWLQNHASKVEKIFLRSAEPEARSEILADVYIRELAKRRAVWCWFQNESESAAMWSIYGHAGVAVRTDLKALNDALPGALNFQIAKIHYCQRENPYRSVDRKFWLLPHLVKGEEFSHEHEVRITTFCLDDEPGRTIQLSNPTGMIKEIVISPKIPFREAEALVSAITRYGSTATVRRSSMLGDLREKEARAAKIDELFRDHWGSEEPDLRLPLDGL
jgi:hypothetical protein